MPGTSTIPDPDPGLLAEPTSSSVFSEVPRSLNYAITHVFLPVRLPDKEEDRSLQKDHTLARAVCAAARAYGAHIEDTSGQAQWNRITKMLDHLQASVQSKHPDSDDVISQLHGMQTGDILAFFIRPQNAGIVLTKREDFTLYESLEVSPSGDAIEGTAGSLICSYPRSAIEVPNEVFDNADFQVELATFLSRRASVDSNTPAPPSQWITALLTGIVQSVGCPTGVPRITKRVRGHSSWVPSTRNGPMIDIFGTGLELGDFDSRDWNRSSLWLFVRIAIQMSLDRSPLGRTTYKEFMLFVVCTLARDPESPKLSSDLLHLMSSKILQRLRKLGSSISGWLSDMALKTCTSLRDILDEKWKKLNTRPSLFRNPSQDELVRDTHLSLLGSREYILSALVDPGHNPVDIPFDPSHHRRGSLEDFLSSDGTFFQEAFAADPDTTLYDIERLVEEGIDDWLACVTDVEEACVQLEMLMDRYMRGARRHRKLNPEDTSIMMLTAIELFVAINKLVVREIPMLADYSPEFPIAFLQKLLLRKAGSLHRLSRAYQYLSARHSQSHPGWSVLSNQFTPDSFAVRYYDQSPDLQNLKAHIEQDEVVNECPSGCRDQSQGCGSVEGADISESPLPTSPSRAKALIFELKCPDHLRVWRSAAPRILFYFYKFLPEDASFDPEDKDNLLMFNPALRAHFVEQQGPLPSIQIHCVYLHTAVSGSLSRPDNTMLYYAIQHPNRHDPAFLGLSRWCQMTFYDADASSYHLQYQLRGHNECLSCKDLAKYVLYTSHTPNNILSAQADCPADLSLDEFITFAHLRSGSGLLQWINILRGLRSRTLNFRRHQVHFLLAQAVFQVGPLDLNTGMWIWHQELQDPFFCYTLLDELYSLFVDVAACSFDGVLMSTIALLLTRVLASSPGEDISERAIKLLLDIRRKTFNWVQELSYDLARAPTNRERRDLLQDMAATCRSTFDVDPVTVPKLFRLAEDIDALLACAAFIAALSSKHIYEEYSRVLLERDCRLSFSVEGFLRDTILADPSDRGIDLAVGRIFSTYQPGAARWESLQYPNTRWLTCKAEQTVEQPSRTLHLNLLEGILGVGGRPLVGLPPRIIQSPKWQQIFQNQGFLTIPSSLPGMDFTTLAVMSKYKVHFSMRDGDLVVRAQCSQTGNILELIPQSILQEDLPPTLVDDHVHWLDLSTMIIEVRPLALPWEQSSENWRIDCTSGEFHMYKGCETLVDVRSPTWEMVSKCFECLNGDIKKSYTGNTLSNNLLITVSPTNSPQSTLIFQLSIALPLYSLSFYVNESGELESRDFKDMVYDENQCIGTLIGLDNLLVLRQRTHLAEELIFRRILIPSGSPGKHGDHCQVRVNLQSDSPDQPLYHIYSVDTEIGCLTGNGNPTSMRYLAHLHSMTNYHRPDPLTRKTGAQAAFCLLQSAGCRSFMQLKAFSNTYLGGLWDSPTQYPQISAMDGEIRKRYHWNNEKRANTDALVKQNRAARRAAHLFPWNSTESTSSEDWDSDLDCSTPKESESELEEIISSTASAIRRWSSGAPTMDIILAWVELWGNNKSTSNLVQTTISKVHDILEKKKGTSLQFQLLFLLPTIAYSSPFHQAAFLSLLVVFAKQFQIHLDVDCKISDGYRLTEDVVWSRVLGCTRFKKRCLGRDPEKHSITVVVKQVLKDWPSDAPSTDSLDSCCWGGTPLGANLKDLFSSCYRNLNLKEHLVRALAETGPSAPPRQLSSLQYRAHQHTPPGVTLEWLLSNRPAPKLPPPHDTFLHISLKDNNPSIDDVPALDRLFSSLKTDNSFQLEYLARLDTSAQRDRRQSQMHVKEVGKDLIDPLKRHYVQRRADYVACLTTVQQSLAPTTDPDEQLLEKFCQWPPITADVLLRYLATTSPFNLSEQWKKCLVSLALLLLGIQRARRLLRFALEGLDEEFAKELEGEGCDGWNAEEHPDWLLIQIQGNFLVRRAQAETAIELISPRSGENTVMQLNMGEGKSSVIVPIAASALADGNQLVRVIVPKALTVQTFEVLVGRLGGLANRPVYYLPFSRTPDAEPHTRIKAVSSYINQLHKFMSQCMAERGILLVQPEHVISLKLMSVEQQISENEFVSEKSSMLQKSIYQHIMAVGLSLKSIPKDSFVGSIFQWLSQPSNCSSNKDTAQVENHAQDVRGILDSAPKWLSLQKWIHSHARDIFDESDEILHTRFQLIYTIGSQRHIDGYPDRWTITQQVLSLVKERAHTLSRNHPNSMELECGPPGSFPHIRIARSSNVGRHLVLLIVDDVMAGRLPNFNFVHIPSELQDAIRSFISDEDILQVPETAKMVEEYAKGSHESYLWNGLLLLRGLLASNILLFSHSERRWRVDYGLQAAPQMRYDSGPQTPKRLAVPYRAKDMPALNTQFGHPDITVILTCLSYYYGGLAEDQLRITFEILLNQDEPSTEYALWIKEYDSGLVPDSLQKLGEINLKSSEQWEKVIFPLFSRNKGAIDLYLSRVVFPKEAKEFPWKLTGSSWDLAEKRDKPITGFSGTQDGRWLLPMSVAQRDLDHQQGTDARVLGYLLKPENDFYMVTHGNGKRQTTVELLRVLAAQEPRIRVLLDIGAQILDLSNRQVAKAWLDIAPDISGGIYFNEKGELMVLTQNGVTLPMSSSPLSYRLDCCVVYLDHAHTRGTDIKLPVGSRAAVMLGPRVTKDRLVQGCMRMRKLGHGHSVMFFAPLEVDQTIRALASKQDQSTRITTADVLCWAIHETWADIQQRAPHWAQQGMNHKLRYDALSRFCNDEITTEQLSDAWIQPECKSLVDLYAPDANTMNALSSLDPSIRQRCKALGVLSLPHAQMVEEQEREVNREAERERDVELPPKARPEKHTLHGDVVKFVKTGVIPALHPGSAFRPVFTTLEQSSAAPQEADVWSSSILATVDFCTTIKPESTRGTLDQYLRPVQWILSCRKGRDQLLVLISPFEADLLLPVIRTSEHVHLHIYVPRTSQRMKPSDDLRMYAIPPLPVDWSPPWALIDQLNVFSGQLYLSDHTSYLRLCRFLGVPTKEVSNDTAVRRNVFQIPGRFEEDEITLSESPLPCVRALLAIRNRGLPFAETHMGKIFQGKLLTEEDF